MATIGTTNILNVPLPADNADIQKAFAMYHYGAISDPGTITDVNAIGYRLLDLKTNKISTTPTAIPFNDDLNNYIVTGNYSQSASLPTGLNHPTLSGTKYPGMLSVIADISGGFIYQTYVMSGTTDTQNTMFWRVKRSTVWGNWVQTVDPAHTHSQYALVNDLNTKPTQQIGYKDTATTAINGSPVKKIVIASPNVAGTGPNAAGYTAAEGDLWFW